MDDRVEAVVREALHDTGGGWTAVHPPQMTRQNLAEGIRRRRRSELKGVALVAAGMAVVSFVSLRGGSASPGDLTAGPFTSMAAPSAQGPPPETGSHTRGGAPADHGAPALPPPAPGPTPRGHGPRAPSIAPSAPLVTAPQEGAPPGVTRGRLPTSAPVGPPPTATPPTQPAPEDPPPSPTSVTVPLTADPSPSSTAPSPTTFFYDDQDSGTTVTVPLDAVIHLELTACQGARWLQARSSAPGVVVPESIVTSPSEGSATAVLRAVGSGRAVLDTSASSVCMTSASLFHLTVIVT